MSPPVVGVRIDIQSSVDASADKRFSTRVANTPANWFIQLMGQQRQGRGCLPYYLGLEPVEFEQVVQTLSARVGPAVMANHLSTGEIFERALLRQELLELRRDEWLELRNLVQAFAANDEVQHLQLAAIIAAGCLGGDHLWRDLGFSQRAELSEFMGQNFPALAALNSKDMKWKKFFYKQLCELGGGYVCRSPSCEACSAYSDCFGSED